LDHNPLSHILSGSKTKCNKKTKSKHETNNQFQRNQNTVQREPKKRREGAGDLEEKTEGKLEDGDDERETLSPKLCLFGVYEGHL
jgi:hypothetical protein